LDVLETFGVDIGQQRDEVFEVRLLHFVEKVRFNGFIRHRHRTVQPEFECIQAQFVILERVLAVLHVHVDGGLQLGFHVVEVGHVAVLHQELVDEGFGVEHEVVLREIARAGVVEPLHAHVGVARAVVIDDVAVVDGVVLQADVVSG